jgi:hypothetical protein
MLKTIRFLVFLSGYLGVLSHCLQAQSPVETYDSTKAYSVGALVLVGEESYIATATSLGKNPPDNTDVWTNLSVAASSLGVSSEAVPSLSTSEILNSLPDPTPPGSNDTRPSFISAYKLNMNYATGSLVILEQKSYVALQPVPANISPPNPAYWADLAAAASQLGVPLEEVPGKPIEEILGALPGSPQAKASNGPITSYDPQWNYSTGSLVLVGSDSYIATREVPLGASPPNSTYWTNLSVVAASLSKPVEEVPTLSTADILGSLPGAAPSRFNFSASVKLEGTTSSETNPGRIHLHANQISSIPQGSLLSQIKGDVQIDLQAIPINGYVFVKWEGDYNSTSSQIAFTMETDRTLLAYFARDLADNDQDGLSNYEEAVTYGTNKDSNDSDGDGLSDKEELEIGCNPNFSDAVLFDYIKSKPEFLKLVPASEYEKAISEPEANATQPTPYTVDWFYLPSRGWLWTNNSSYPFFFDASTSGWLYFVSGGDKPRFYEYKTSQWIVIE